MTRGTTPLDRKDLVALYRDDFQWKGWTQNSPLDGPLETVEPSATERAAGEIVLISNYHWIINTTRKCWCVLDMDHDEEKKDDG